MSPLSLSPVVIDAVFAHARAEFPRECCGVILGRPEDPASLRFQPFENLQDRLHAMDPRQYPRDGRTAYHMDPLRLERLVDAEQQAGRDLVAIVHSHPGHPSYFSSTDQAAAAPFGFPTYEQAWQLVASVFDGQVCDLKAFRWDEGQARYLEAPLEGLPPLPGPPPGARPYEDV
jgi:proteasome lid subunit RPN8/RPN11